MPSLTSATRRTAEDGPLTALAAGASPPCYLTDGRRLYRWVDDVPTVAEFVWLEDCRTLDIILVSDDVLDRLRFVCAGAVS